eukprot:CAMPEP_0172928214 /NCGR_PEP_ID=MMETSP1075-20121228/217863_1 /TAXON_ID=2916 /ORGANISM="Ceratium fusus, Strain PA161109" /LENGTH=227 /DNA_ID=CAMNT_0013789493 /DNA_START=108 /DNA_END=788 /DNA_ORIENTATION=+
MASGVQEGSKADNFLKAGVSLHAHHAALRADMHNMMVTGDDDVEFGSLAHRGHETSKRGLLRSHQNQGTASMDDYIKDAEVSLSAALGPRWTAQKLEDDADRNTQALLRGISGPKQPKADNFLKAGVSLRAHHAALRADMRNMMLTGDDDVEFGSLAHRGQETSKRGLLRSYQNQGTASMDDYIKDSEAGLSAALGPRWTAKKLEDDADRNTQALLRGISGPKATGA